MRTYLPRPSMGIVVLAAAMMVVVTSSPFLVAAESEMNWVFDERRVTGATRWAHIKPDPSSLSGASSEAAYPKCDGAGFSSSTSLGATQSPINIHRASVEPSLPRLPAEWIDAHTFEISNDGVEVLFTPTDVVPTFIHPTNQNRYNLLYWRLVVPSGHSFGSGPRAAEFQLVHALSSTTTTEAPVLDTEAPPETTAAPVTTPSPTTQGTASASTTVDGEGFAIVIVTMESGYGPHEYLSDLISLIPDAPSDVASDLTTAAMWDQTTPRSNPNVQIDRNVLSVQQILPHTGSYITYTGSLPTPPCTEEVPYLVYADPIKISQEQLAVLQAKVLRDVPRQTRLAQPLGTRTHPQLHHFRRPHYAYTEPDDVRNLGFTGITLAIGLGFCCLGAACSVAALLFAVLTTRKPDT